MTRGTKHTDIFDRASSGLLRESNTGPPQNPNDKKKKGKDDLDPELLAVYLSFPDRAPDGFEFSEKGFFETAFEQQDPLHTWDLRSALNDEICMITGQEPVIPEIRVPALQRNYTPANVNLAVQQDFEVLLHEMGYDPQQIPGIVRLRDIIVGCESGDRPSRMFGLKHDYPEDLTQMTLGELKEKMLQHVRNGYASGASGCYQVVYKTLVEEMGKLGLSDNDYFDIRTQNRICVSLLEKRKLSKFLNGEINANQFADNLAYEWAGLKNSDGIGAYDHDGINKGTQSTLTALNTIDPVQQS